MTQMTPLRSAIKFAPSALRMLLGAAAQRPPVTSITAPVV